MVEAYFTEHLNSMDIGPEVSEGIMNRIRRSSDKILASQDRLHVKPHKLQKKAAQVSPKATQERQSLLDKKVRQEFFEEEKKKVEITQQKAKEWIREQKLREKKIKDKQMAEVERILTQEKESFDKYHAEQEQKFKERYHAQLEAMRQKKEQKMKEIQDLKERGKTYMHIQKRPLFKVMEEKYQQEVELPSLEQRKTELAKLRMLHAPIDHTSIKEHMSWYDEVKKQNNERILRNVSQRKLEDQVGLVTRNFTSSTGARLLKEDKDILNNAQRTQLEKLELIRKRNNYAKVVKEIYTPTINTQKHEEVHKRLEKRTAPLLQNRKKENLSQDNIVWKPRKYPKNPLVPEPSPKREGHFIDYLAMKRKERETKSTDNRSAIDWNKISVDGDDKIEKIKQMSNRVENEVRKHEQKMMNSNSKFAALKSSEEINDMLVSSIKAKLSVLEQMRDK